jgi:uncharacterized damage-inducible protein DinB
MDLWSVPTRRRKGFLLPEKAAKIDRVPIDRVMEARVMKKVCSTVTLVLALAILAAPAWTQETAKKNSAPKPALSSSQVVLDSWNDIGRKLIAMAEDFPEDKYDYRPSASTRSFAERLIHAASANYFFINSALGQKLPSDEDPPRAQFRNRGAVVEYVKKSFADGAAAIKSKGDSGISDLVIDPFGYDDPQHAGKAQIRLVDLAHNLIEHSGEVYGQLSVYYRVARMVPPESRPRK